MRKAIFTLLTLVLTSVPAFSQNLVVNGGFETPAGMDLNPPFGSINVTNGTPGYSAGAFGWTIGFVNVDHINTAYWSANSGNYSLDLNGNGIGLISQSFATVVGQGYTLSFWFSNNGDMPANTTAMGSVKVIDAGMVNLVNAGLSASGNVLPNLTYGFFTIDFVATTTTTTLTFEGASAIGSGYPNGFDNSQGIVLDDISVTPTGIPEPGTVMVACGAIGMFGAGAYSYRRAQLRRRQREAAKAKLA